MKMIILAAGQGIRLKPYTDDRPKCMVEYRNRPIIDYILETADAAGISDIAVVNGYRKDVLTEYLGRGRLTYYTNERYNSTNMVSTLFSAQDFMDDDLIISYADIIYSKEILCALAASGDDFSVVVDRKWKELWSQRMANPLDDAETLKLSDGKIIELGKKAKSYDEIQGQYIGLIKISKNVLNRVIDFYHSIDKSKVYDGKDFDNIYMTSFIQLIIDNLLDVKPVFIDGGWIEIDEVGDLKASIV